MQSDRTSFLAGATTARRWLKSILPSVPFCPRIEPCRKALMAAVRCLPSRFSVVSGGTKATAMVTPSSEALLMQSVVDVMLRKL